MSALHAFLCGCCIEACEKQRIRDGKERQEPAWTGEGTYGVSHRYQFENESGIADWIASEDSGNVRTKGTKILSFERWMLLCL